MDHYQIEQEEIIDRYILGKLSAKEESSFEEHYFSCDQCFTAVREKEKVILGLKDATSRGVFVLREVKKAPALELLGWLKSVTFSPVMAMATSILVFALLYPAWRGIFTVSELKRQLNELRQPQANVPRFSLQQTRVGEEQQIISLPEDSEDKLFILSFNILEKTIPAPKYRAKIFNGQGKMIWQEENIQGFGAYEIFSMSCNLDFFSAGNYWLKVYEVDIDNDKVIKEFSYPFKIVKQEGNSK